MCYTSLQSSKVWELTAIREVYVGVPVLRRHEEDNSASDLSVSMQDWTKQPYLQTCGHSTVEVTIACFYPRLRR